MTKVSKKVQDVKTVLTTVELAKLVANQNLGKSSNRGKSTNDYLVEILLNKKPLTRPEIVEQVLATKFKVKLETIIAESKTQEDMITASQKLYKTAKNSVDTSLSNSNNNSSFSFNPNYKHLTIVKENGTYTIVENTIVENTKSK